MKKVHYGIYDDEEVLLHAVKELKGKGIGISEVYSPFPIHGLEKALGYKHTRLSTAAFIYGLTGLSLGVLMTWYMMIIDWPVIIGGKPNFTYAENFTSFIPVLFELTVFCAAHGMVLSFLIVCGLFPGAKETNPLPETTSHLFAIELEENNLSKEEIKNMLDATHAINVETLERA